jgi:hypothetical protein
MPVEPSILIIHDYKLIIKRKIHIFEYENTSCVKISRNS